MSIRDDILTALRQAYGNGPGPWGLTAEQLLARYDTDREKSSRPAVDATPGATYEPRTERYMAALRTADPYALVERRDDLARFAVAAIAAADTELDPVYRDAYGTGREHAGAAGWLLQHFEAVTSTSNGSYGVAEEYRCRTCGAIGAQGEGPRSLLDLVAMAARHECLPQLLGGDA